MLTEIGKMTMHEAAQSGKKRRTSPQRQRKYIQRSGQCQCVDTHRAGPAFPLCVQVQPSAVKALPP